LYLEGRIDAASEELLFRELAKNTELRREMNAQVRLHSLTKRDAARVLPSERDKAAIFGRLGLAGAGAASMLPSSSVAQTLLSVPRFAQTKHFFRTAALMLLSAFLTWYFLRFGNSADVAQKQVTKLNAGQSAPIEMTMLVPVEKRVERIIEKEIVTRVETRYKTIVRYIKQTEDMTDAQMQLAVERMNAGDASAVSNNTSRSFDNVNSDNTHESLIPRSPFIKGANDLEKIGSEQPLVTDLEPAPTLAFTSIIQKPENMLLLDSLDLPVLPALPKAKEFIPTAFLSVRVAADLSGMQGAWQFKPFSTAALSVGYNWTQSGILGLEASGDILNRQSEQGLSVAFVPIASVFYRHTLNDWTLEIPYNEAGIVPERITPFVQASLGSSGAPIAGRLMLGATFYGVSPDKRRFSNSLGIEVTHLFAAPQERYIPKVSLSFSQNFRL
jgi:hypothetical protein